MLVVDDSKVYRELMATLLRPHCREVVAVGNVAAALERLAESARFDLVICDVVMEGDDGFSLLEQLRERGEPPMPVVMVTGRSSHDGAARARELGAVGYLEKPTTVRQILNAVVPRTLPRGRNIQPRWRCSGTAVLVDAETSGPGPLRWDVYNICPTGAFLETKGPVPLGCELDLELEIGGRKARVRALVVRVQEPSWLDVGGVGVRFIQPDQALEEFVARAIADPRTSQETD